MGTMEGRRGGAAVAGASDAEGWKKAPPRTRSDKERDGDAESDVPRATRG